MVIGGGGVGLCVVIVIVEINLYLDVVIVFKVYLMCSYIVLVEGGVVVVIGDDDSFDEYVYDMVFGGDWLCD